MNGTDRVLGVNSLVNLALVVAGIQHVLERPTVHLEDWSERALTADGQILGTYLHELFESRPGLRRAATQGGPTRAANA